MALMLANPGMAVGSVAGDSCGTTPLNQTWPFTRRYARARGPPAPMASTPPPDTGTIAGVERLTRETPKMPFELSPQPQTLPALSTAAENPSPAATDSMVAPIATSRGTELPMSVPSPASPEVSAPQKYTPP